MRGQRDRGGRGRGRGRGKHPPQRSAGGGIALNYASVADFERGKRLALVNWSVSHVTALDPLEAFTPSNRSSGRGQPRFAGSGPRTFHHGGLGWAQTALQDISNSYGGSSSLLKPVKFVRGERQDLLHDPDTVLLQPGVHAELRRDSIEPRPPAATLAINSSAATGTSSVSTGLRAHTTATDDDDEDEEIVYVPPADVGREEMPSLVNPEMKEMPEQDRSSTSSALAAPALLATTSRPASWSANPVSVAEGAETRPEGKAEVKRKTRRGRRKAKVSNIPREGDSDLDWGSDGPPLPKGSDIERLTASLREKTISSDELDNMTLDDDLEDSAFALSFIRSMANNVHISEHDIALEAALRELEDKGMPWETDPDGSSASDAESIIQRVEEARWTGDLDQSDDDEEGATPSDSSVDSDEVLEVMDAEEAAELERALRASHAHDDFATFQNELESDEFEHLSQPVRSRRKGKGKAPKLPGVDSDDEFLLAIQQQWEADRANKASRKKARAAARASDGPTKAQRKKAKRKTGDEADALAPHDLHGIHHRIRAFALDVSTTSALGLPPMNKRQRVAIHLFAEAYGLSSKSVGKGANRAPMLQRTARTAVHGVSMRKIHSIIEAAEGKTVIDRGSGRPGGRTGSLWRVLDGSQDKVRASPVMKNREGAIVGYGAEALHEGNVGYQLLARMGWTAGERIGVNGGLDVPIVAFVKTSKRGLGH